MTNPYFRLSAFYFAYFAFVGGFGPYFGLYLQSLGSTAVEIGSLLSLMQLMRIFAPNLWASLADGTGRQLPLLRVSLAASVIACAGLLFTQSFWGLFLTLSLLAFCSGGAMPLAEAMTFAHVKGDLGRYGPIRVWGSVGFIASVLAIGAMLDLLPIGILPWTLLAALAGSLAAIGFFRDLAADRHAGAQCSAWRILRRSEVSAFFLACFFMCAAHGPLYTFYSIYLADQGYSKSLIGVMWSLGVVAEIAVFLLSPGIFRRFSPRAVLIASFGCAVVRFAAIGWGVSSIAVLAAAQVLHAASFGSYHAAALGLVNRWFQGGQRARGQALYSSLTFGAGGMVGGLASGAAWDAIGPQWTFTAGSVCALLGLILAGVPGTMAHTLNSGAEVK